MFAKFLAALSLTSALLAGCGTAAAPNAIPSAIAPKLAAKQTGIVELRMPVGMLKIVEDHKRRLERESLRHDTFIEVHTRYYASRDGFKSKFQGGDVLFRPIRQEGHMLVVPFRGAPGPVEYYLEVRASERIIRDAKLVKEYPSFYVSDYGRNFKGELR